MAILTIQPSNIDTILDSGNPTINYGNNTYITLYNAGLWRPILRFDFSALPTGSVISAAVLSLYYWYNDGGGYDPVGRTFWAYELTQTAWVELEATWNIYKTGSNWTAAGGDYTTTSGASITMPGSYPAWIDWNVLTLVQHFQSNHSNIANFLIRDETESGGANAYFYSSEYTVNTTLCPKLIITYTPPDAAVWLRRITINRDKSPRIWKRKEI